MKYRCHDKIKYNKSRNYDKGLGCYIVYYNNHSYDIFDVYSPKAAVRKIKKLIERGLI